jgi:hypothetical protein
MGYLLRRRCHHHILWVQEGCRGLNRLGTILLPILKLLPSLLELERRITGRRRRPLHEVSGRPEPRTPLSSRRGHGGLEAGWSSVAEEGGLRSTPRLEPRWLEVAREAARLRWALRRPGHGPLLELCHHGSERSPEG